MIGVIGRKCEGKEGSVPTAECTSRFQWREERTRSDFSSSSTPVISWKIHGWTHGRQATERFIM